MASVDDRVVQMTFDNAAFERKIAGTMLSLDKLQESLNFAGGKRGIDDLAKAGKGFHLGGMTSAVEGVSGKFLALSTIAITALAKITSSAIDAGVNIGKSLSLDLVIDGFREYETNINSIQTILANTKSKGTTLDEVTESLDILNTFADQTIYNFGEMTRNIGTFTAAGVDLDTSVQSIKGIANLAAISGSNSQQAATAMYQLSQAISTGQVRLQDWNSVVNAGLGGEVFQKALFETGKTMGTIADVPIDQTFEQWTDAGNTFRGSLEENWLSAEVLTTTLQGFTGEMTEAQLLAIGYTKEAAAEILEMGQTGLDAATKVKTLTQLVDTVKEAIGSGWSTSFRTIFGDFEEAKVLFTGISETLGELIGNSADARNEVLTGWKDLGGRTALINGLGNAFTALQLVLKPIRASFRRFFPAATAEQLADLSKRFEKFTERLQIGGETSEKIARAFDGLFGGLRIGFEVLKGIATTAKDLFQAFTDGEGTLDFFANLGDRILDLNDSLVKGGGIKDFFANLTEVLKDPLPHLEKLRDRVLDFFKNIDIGEAFGDLKAPDILSDALDRLTQRFDNLKEAVEKTKDFLAPIKESFGRLAEILDPITQGFKDWFKNLGSEMAAAAEPGDFDAVLDAVNLGILGGLAALITKFLSSGFSFGKGFLDNINEGLEELTGVLSAMQADIKANALLKIAGAIGILALSLLVLATINSEDLTKALTAMSIGFGQLVTVFAVINKLALGPKSAASFAILAGGLILLSGAMLLLSVAVKVLAGLSWQELAKGLSGVTALLTIMVVAVKPLSANSTGMIQAGVGIIAIAVALNLIALAVKQLASLSWEEMAQGLTGVATSLIIIVGAMRLIPDNMAKKTAGLIGLGVALNLIALAVRQFSSLSWEEMAKGLVGVAGALVAIAIGMKLMPKTLPLTAAGLVLVSGALLIISRALREVSELSWEELAKGLVGLGGALLILVLAVNAMNGAVLGAAALTTVSFAILTLASAMAVIGKMSLKEIGKALLGIAGVLVVLGGTAAILAPLIPALLGLGAAMLILGAGFALFGVGANLTARAFTQLAKAGEAGIGVLLTLIDAIIQRIPALITAFAVGLLELAMVFLDATPVLIEQFGVIFEQLLQTIIDLTPELVETVIVLITGMLEALRATVPDFITTGLELLLALLSGIRDNIGEITTLVVEIIVEFVKSVTGKMDDIVTVGLELLVAFIDGILDNLDLIVDSAARLITAFITAIAGLLIDVIAAGLGALVALLSGITDNLSLVVEAVVDVITTLITEVGEGAVLIIAAGVGMLIDLMFGIYDNITLVVAAVATIITTFIEEIAANASKVVTAGVDTVLAFLEGVADNTQRLIDGAAEIVIDFINGLADSIRNNSEELRAAGWNLASAIIDGMTGGLASRAGEVKDAAVGVAKSALDGALGFLGISSPSKEFMKIGEFVVAGFAKGMDDDDRASNSAADLASRASNRFRESLTMLADSIEFIDDFSPTISPVLDLTRVERDARKIGGLLNSANTFASTSSFAQARTIASTELDPDIAGVSTTAGPTEVKFEQNNYSPKQLSTLDIYRQTRSQITLAKEELKI